MPLVKRCTLAAMQANVRREIRGRCARKRGKGKAACQAQAVAIGYSVLRKACGVRTKKKLTPKQIVAIGARRRGRRRGA